jgi:branched-chain amino acid transport system permease protein
MTTSESAATVATPRHRVVRSTRGSQISTGIAIVAALALFAAPNLFTTGVVQKLTTLFIYVILAVMWNALAGYGGLVSVGQQAFIGFGAYGTVWLTLKGLSPFPAMILATLASGVLAALVALVVLHLKGGQFAIGTWVIAETFGLLVLLNAALGAGTGTSLRGLNVYDPANRAAYIYWFTLGFLLLLLVMLFLLLRLKTGAALQAIRDDEEAAASLGVRVTPIKFGIYVLAGFGCGGAGALILAHTIFITPTSIFGVQWSAMMIFIVLIGGLGTFEGPIVGAVIYFLMQDQFSDYQTWYFIGLGVVAILFALFLPRGLWSLVADRLPAQMPVGYLLRPVAGRRATRGDT